MSDYVQIVENNEGKFEVSTCDVESDWHDLIGICSTLKGAILMAKKYIKRRIKEGSSIQSGLEIYFKEGKNELLG